MGRGNSRVRPGEGRRCGPTGTRAGAGMRGSAGVGVGVGVSVGVSAGERRRCGC
jgi:hypothetical protein